MATLDASLDAMLQHARVAFGAKAKHTATSNSSSQHGPPPRRGLMAPSVDDGVAVQALLDTSDVDAWVANRRNVYPAPHCMSPDRKVVSKVDGHDRRYTPMLSHVHSPKKESSQAQHSPAVLASYRRGTTEDVLESIVVRGDGLPLRSHGRPKSVDASSPSRGQVGPSIGDRVSGYCSERVHAAAWGQDGRLAIGFDDNDDPVVIVRPQTLAVDSLHQPASSTSSKVTSAESQPLETKNRAPPSIVIDQDMTSLKSPGVSASSHPHGKPLPLPSPDAATTFKDVHHRFINPHAQAIPQTNEGVEASSAGTSHHAAWQENGSQAANTPLIPPLDETRRGSAAVVDSPSSGPEERAEHTAHHHHDPSAVALVSRRQPSPQEDHGTQTEVPALLPLGPSPPSLHPTNTLTSSGWMAASTELSFAGHARQSPTTIASGVAAAAPTGSRQLPMFKIPQDDDDIQFAGPPHVHAWADDRDPAFLSAVATHRQGHRDVISPAEFRMMIVGSHDAARGSLPQASASLNDGAVEVRSGGAGAIVPVAQSNRSASSSALPQATYFTFRDEFPMPPQPPHKPKTKCCCCR